jgi:glutathione S-transferase
MQGIAYVSLATVLIILVYFWTMMGVGRARQRHGIKAPATTGNPEFERVMRVQENTLEQLVIVLPAIWLFSITIDDRIAGLLGVIFAIGRIVYAQGYRADADKRGPGFLIGGIATLIALIGALVGVIWKGFLV